MTRTSLDDALWASLMLTMQQIPRAREIPQGLSLGSAMKRHCGGLSRPRCGSAGRVRRGATCQTTWTVGPASATASGVGRCAAGGSWCSRRCARPCPRTGWCCWTARHARRTAPRAVLRAATPRRSASGAAAAACSKLHPCADGAGRILRLVPSPGQHSDLRHAPALVSGIPARDAALDRGYVSARLRAAFAADGCTVHTPPKLGMVDPPPWDRAIYARRHHVENLFSKLKDWGRIALRRDKTRRSWMGFAHLIASVINLRIAEFSHRP